MSSRVIRLVLHIFVVQSVNCVWLFSTPWTIAHQATPTSTISGSLLKLVSIESVILSNHLIPCRPLLLLPLIFPSIRVFSSESVLYISWPKYWSFSFNISPSSEYSGLISFRMDWLDLLAVQEIPLAFGNFQKKRPPAILAFENIITPYFKEKQSYMLKINLYFFNKNIKLSI